MTIEPSKETHGRHGGPLLKTRDGLVEISVFETNVPPRFRLYFLDQNGGPQSPASGTATIETVRPTGERQLFEFRPGDAFLESTSNIPEPHEFDVILTLTKAGERQRYQTRFTEEAHGHDHGTHGHTHGLVDPMITTTGRGLWAIKWSFVALLITASLQLSVVVLSHSVALLADMIHNFGDAATAIPLGVAFAVARRPPSRRFTYGFGRAEDLAGLAVVLTILTSAVVAAYLAIERLLHPHEVSNLGALAAASIIGFLGNEGVATFRIKVGKEIGSAALIADGYHARTDGWTSLAVLVGALGVHFGYPMADPIIGLVITAAILGVVWQSVKAVFSRMLDGVEPAVIDEVRATSAGVAGVVAVTDVRARWIGHRLRAEVNVSVAPDMTVAVSHAIAKDVEHRLLHHLKFLSGAIIHMDPSTESGEARHRPAPHQHDGLELHSH
jgi:cation diffusion facilitator family transporter